MPEEWKRMEAAVTQDTSNTHTTHTPSTRISHALNNIYTQYALLYRLLIRFVRRPRFPAASAPQTRRHGM